MAQEEAVFCILLKYPSLAEDIPPEMYQESLNFMIFSHQLMTETEVMLQHHFSQFSLMILHLPIQLMFAFIDLWWYFCKYSGFLVNLFVCSIVDTFLLHAVQKYTFSFVLWQPICTLNSKCDYFVLHDCAEFSQHDHF